MTLLSTIRCGIKAAKDGPADSGKSSFALAAADDIQVLNGTTANKADLIFSDERTLAASASEDLDLAGALEDAFGQTLSFAKIKAILVEADATNGGNIEVGGAPANAFLGPFLDASDKLAIPASGRVMLNALMDGWTVTAATADLLRVANADGAAAAKYKITLIGTSA